MIINKRLLTVLEKHNLLILGGFPMFPHSHTRNVFCKNYVRYARKKIPSCTNPVEVVL